MRRLPSRIFATIAVALALLCLLVSTAIVRSHYVGDLVTQSDLIGHVNPEDQTSNIVWQLRKRGICSGRYFSSEQTIAVMPHVESAPPLFQYDSVQPLAFDYHTVPTGVTFVSGKDWPLWPVAFGFGILPLIYLIRIVRMRMNRTTMESYSVEVIASESRQN